MIFLYRKHRAKKASSLFLILPLVFFIVSGVVVFAMLTKGQPLESGLDNTITNLGSQPPNQNPSTPNTILSRIETPTGFTRVETDGFGEFVRNYPLKPSNHKVRLYNGNLKTNQNAHWAVFDLPLERYDLQQCADSVMRFFAEYFYQTNQEERIKFYFTNGFLCDWETWKRGNRISVLGNKVNWVSGSPDDSYESLVKYLKVVFSYAGTLSMSQYEASPIQIQETKIGNVFLQGGSPGHVVMIVDIAEKDGKKAFLLAQGFMPAQEFHILKNPSHQNDPWYYEEEISYPFKTPEWTFKSEALYRLKY